MTEVANSAAECIRPVYALVGAPPGDVAVDGAANVYVIDSVSNQALKLPATNRL